MPTTKITFTMDTSIDGVNGRLLSDIDTAVEELAACILHQGYQDNKPHRIAVRNTNVSKNFYEVVAARTIRFLSGASFNLVAYRVTYDYSTRSFIVTVKQSA